MFQARECRWNNEKESFKNYVLICWWLKRIFSEIRSALSYFLAQCMFTGYKCDRFTTEPHIFTDSEPNFHVTKADITCDQPTSVVGLSQIPQISTQKTARVKYWLIRRLSNSTWSQIYFGAILAHLSSLNLKQHQSSSFHSPSLSTSKLLMYKFTPLTTKATMVSSFPIKMSLNINLWIRRDINEKYFINETSAPIFLHFYSLQHWIRL